MTRSSRSLIESQKVMAASCGSIVTETGKFQLAFGPFDSMAGSFQIPPLNPAPFQPAHGSALGCWPMHLSHNFYLSLASMTAHGTFVTWHPLGLFRPILPMSSYSCVVSDAGSEPLTLSSKLLRLSGWCRYPWHRKKKVIENKWTELQE